MIAPAIESIRSVVLRGTVPRDSLTPFARTLDAPFVGSDLTALPAASAFGILARIVRLNVFEPIDLFRHLGIRTRRSDNLSEVMTFSEARQTALAGALRLSSAPPTWNLTAWYPFQASSEVLRAQWRFRYCPLCMRVGYHTLLHQLPWIHRCPWHSVALSTACRRCGREVCALADWLPDQNLACPCGHALLSTDDALAQSAGSLPGASNFIAGYLEWAAQERTRTVLIAPELPDDTASALGELVHPPRAWAHKCGHLATRSHSRVWRASPYASAADNDAIRQLDTLRQDRPGFLTVPAQMRGAMSCVAAGLALKLPPNTLTDREMTLFLAGAGIDAPKEFEPARRGFSGTLSALPPWEVAGEQYLNLACLHPVSYRAVAKLLNVALDGRSLFDFHGQATALELNLLVRACGHLLARGYAEGLRATLSRHIPDLYRMHRDAPHLTKPWLLATRDQTRIVAIRAVWNPMDFRHTAADLLEEADEVNQRRERTRRRGRPKRVCP